MWVNVGARDSIDKMDIHTKKELKAAITEDPGMVEFYSTSEFTPFSGTGNSLVIGVKYTVAGPNPYTSRKWFATVEKLANGTIKVK